MRSFGSNVWKNHYVSSLKNILKLFLTLAALGVASSTYGITIMPTWDNTIVTNANAAAITNGIMFAIQAEQANLVDNLTVKILFVNTNVSLGENETWLISPSYSSYLTALKNSATSLNDTNALSRIPNSSTDPLATNSSINLQLPLARLFGFYPGYGPDGFDGTVFLNIPRMNLTRPPGNPSKYDLIAVTEHEMDEVLGFVSSLDSNYPNGPVSPMDLFRYTTNLVRTWTPSGDNAYFSVDGTNLLARFNQNAMGDYHDWWSFTGLWAPPGVTPHPQVQDAFATPNTAPDLGSNELAGLDVIGYRLSSTIPPPPALSIALSGKSRFSLSWPSSYSGYTLQENTNLLFNSWAASTTGSTNPALITSTNIIKFYRLSKASSPGVVTVQAGVSPLSTSLPLQQVTHAYHPRDN